VDSINGVLVARGVSVGVEVSVAGVKMAVCVSKNEAATVPMADVRTAFISGVGEAGGWPPQEANINPIRNTKKVRRALCIFTS
jgi:hypothetical protein